MGGTLAYLLISCCAGCLIDWEQEFVQAQADAMAKSSTIVSENLKTAAAVNKRRHDEGSNKGDIMKIGQNVLLKQTAFKGRHKLADRYHRDKYVVVWVNPEGDVCTIRPVHGGPTKTVNRKYLIHDPRGNDPDVQPKPAQKSDLSSDEDEIQSGNDEEVENVVIFPGLDVDSLFEQNVRRHSLRRNKGVHSNPGHWPRSAVR